MKCGQNKRKQFIYELAKKNRWYEYERYKKYLSFKSEAEVRILTKDLKV
jgi:hypothetical protein